jgi:putative ABC transport system permease protein
MNAIFRDVRFAIQSLGRTPGFTLIAIITLGLGIGANTSMFSILNGYMLRPAPYPERDRVDRIYRATRQERRGGISPADYLDLKSQMAGYGEIAGYAVTDLSLAEPGKSAVMAEGLRVSANLFSTLGARPALGRSFRPDEEVLGNHRVLVISHRYWQNHFGGDGQIIGRKVRVDSEPYEIVGVLPADFSDWRHLTWVDVFRPLGLTEPETRDRNSTKIRLVGLRSAAVPRPQAEAFIADFGRRIARDFPAAHADTTWRIVAIDDSFIDKEGEPIIEMLVALSGFVVLIACSNLANLLLARTMGRAREFAVRSAIGASRSQVLRPLVVESLLIAFAGGLCALLVALWTFDWFAVVSAEPGGNGVGVDLRFDWHVLAWMFGASLFTALAFGVAPAHFVHRLDLNSTLKSGSRGTTGDRGHRRFGRALIVGQFALAMVLLAGAAMFVRGFHEINNRRHGWQSDQLVNGTIVLPDTSYPDDARITDFHRRVLERVEALPGVASASLSYAMPFFGLSEPRRYVIAGRETPPPGQEPSAAINGISPHYFETVGTRLLRGRSFNERDHSTAPKVFIINQAMASGLFGDETPIGRRIAPAGGKTTEWGEIVGVVADVESVYANRKTGDYQLYLPLAQEPRAANQLAVRTAAVAPAGVVEDIRATMAALDPDLPVRKLEPAVTTIARANYQDGVLASVLSALAVLGLGLASLGVYGVIARTVAQRTGEFGIRLALGAQAGDIIRLVLASGAKLAVIGSAIGLVGAFGVARLIAAGFPGMQTSSVPVLIGATVLLVAVAQIAGYLPARHASKISPTEALRAE